MVPTHRHFAQTQACLIRLEQQLDIKGEADGMRSFQKRAENIESERFETALSVPKRHPGCESHDQVKYAPGLLSSPWLMNPDQSPIQCARTEGDIHLALRNWFDQFRNFG